MIRTLRLTAATNPQITDPGNTGDFVSEGMEDGRNSVDGVENEYGQASNFNNTCGIVFQREAAGMVEAIGPQVQVTSGDVSTIYQGDVILGRLACGCDYLNPAASVELFAGTSYQACRILIYTFVGVFMAPFFII